VVAMATCLVAIAAIALIARCGFRTEPRAINMAVVARTVNLWDGGHCAARNLERSNRFHCRRRRSE
jgi:hypothetical protein